MFIWRMPRAKLLRKSRRKPALEAEELELAKLTVRFRPYETVEGSRLEQFKKTTTEFSQITRETRVKMLPEQNCFIIRNKDIIIMVHNFEEKCVLQAHFIDILKNTKTLLRLKLT